MKKLIVLLVTHGAALGAGFALGIYLLPILTAPPSPDATLLSEKAQTARYSASFTRDLDGSDFAHWGEGQLSVSDNEIIHQGKLAPGPDYRLYLVKTFVENEAQFLATKDNAVQVGEIRTFSGFVIDVPDDVKITEYTTVVVWCEAFSEFITAAKYQ